MPNARRMKTLLDRVLETPTGSYRQSVKSYKPASGGRAVEFQTVSKEWGSEPVKKNAHFYIDTPNGSEGPFTLSEVRKRAKQIYGTDEDIYVPER